MSRPGRLFEIIQLLRAASAPVTAARIAEQLEVTKRTVYRDIAALQARRVPIEGEAGIGYVMRAGYDLPPLNFDAEEIEAIVVGLALIGRTADPGLQAAARRAGAKVSTVMGEDGEIDGDLGDVPLYVSEWTDIPEAKVDVAMIRQAIRDEEILRVAYTDKAGEPSHRTVRPFALFYYVEVVVLAAWCEMREDFRHFRLDRIAECRPTGTFFKGEGRHLHRQWRDRGDR